MADEDQSPSIIKTETGRPEVVEEAACVERGALQAKELGLTLAVTCSKNYSQVE